jgi:hypothetical protein
MRSEFSKDHLRTLLATVVLSFVCCPVVALTLQGSAASSPQAVAGWQIACNPDKPIVHSGEDLGLHVFVAGPASQTLRYAWTATGGKIVGEGKGVRWNFNGAMSGIYTSSVVVSSAGKKLGECSVQVTVIEAERGGGEPATSEEARVTARAFLAKGQKETAGYGLYSYLLLGSPPTEATRPRYLKTIQAYLSLIQPVTDLRDYVATSKLNVTYLPVKVQAPDPPTAEWLLANYDFARARILLNLLSPSYQTGPYIVSTLVPLSIASAMPAQYLFQDLSLVPVEPQDLLSWWVRAFLNQAAQQRFWQPQTGELLALKLRTMISVEAMALPEVEKQLGSWIAWAK